jgi:hypothetical protein
VPLNQMHTIVAQGKGAFQASISRTFVGLGRPSP